MAKRNSDDRTRRDLVKGIAGSAGVLGITSTAGCIGGGGGGNNSGGNNSGGGGGGSNGGGGGGNNSGSGSGGTNLLFWTESFDNPNAKEWKSWYQSTLKQQQSVNLKVASSEYEDRRKNFLTGARQGEPDYVEGILNHLTEFQSADLIEPLTDYAKKQDYWSGYTEGAKEAVTYKGDVLGMPWTGNGRALLYRNDIFDDLGLKPPKTAQEFMKVGRTIKEERDDITPFHNCTKEGSARGFQEFMSHVYQHEDQLFRLKGGSWKVVPKEDVLVSVFTNWYHNVWASDNPIANTDQLGTGYQTLDYGYLNGNYAMIECGPWILDGVSEDAVKNQKAAKKVMFENTTVTHLPRDSNGHKGTFLEVKPVMVNAFSENIQEATKAAALYCSPKAMREMKKSGMNLATPLHTDVSSSIETESLEPFKQVAETGRPLAKVPWGEVREAVYPKIQGVAYGEMDPEKAGQTLHEEITGIAEEFDT